MNSEYIYKVSVWIRKSNLMNFDKQHNVRLLRYARQKNAHLPQVNSAFPGFASLPR